MEDGYAICLNEWALDNSIKGELGLLLIISSLTAKEGFCYASNEYFAKLFKTTEQTISKKIKKLEQKKLHHYFIQKTRLRSNFKKNTINENVNRRLSKT